MNEQKLSIRYYLASQEWLAVKAFWSQQTEVWIRGLRILRISVSAPVRYFFWKAVYRAKVRKSLKSKA